MENLFNIIINNSKEIFKHQIESHLEMFRNNLKLIEKTKRELFDSFEFQLSPMENSNIPIFDNFQLEDNNPKSLKDVLEKYCKINDRGYYENNNVSCWLLKNSLNNSDLVEVYQGNNLLGNFTNINDLISFFEK
jgi:hypothetical protein